MENLRYAEKNHLREYDLDTELFKRFDLQVKDLIPVRSVFLLSTDKGKKILKKIEYSIKRLDFINESLNYIEKKYDKLMTFQKDIGGDLYTLWNSDIYCILDLVEGRECEISNPIDLSIASQAIGKLHYAGVGILNEISLANENCDLKKCIDTFKFRLNKLKFIKSLVEGYRYKSDFDNIVKDNIDYYISQIEYSIGVLEDSAYYALCSESDKICLCHNDLAHHNIIIKDEEAYFIDFDYSIIDLRVRDLCNFINKSIKNFAFDIDRVKNILYDYQRVNPLDKREFKVLYGMLAFPEDFYSIVKSYYDKEKTWEEAVFLDRLRKKVGFKVDREEFLNNFKNIYL